MVLRCFGVLCGLVCCVVVWWGVVWCTADERVWRRWLCRDALIVPRFQVPARTQGDQHQCTAVVMIIILWMDCWRCCWLAMMSDKDINIKDLVPDFQFLVIFGMKKFKKNVIMKSKGSAIWIGVLCWWCCLVTAKYSWWCQRLTCRDPTAENWLQRKGLIRISVHRDQKSSGVIGRLLAAQKIGQKTCKTLLAPG